uniref:Uncharacterized protein n=1 Tax=Noctiluca scintillans TaxID=2966 RepID=A0A7S0ZWY3_NOCSC
MDPVDSPRAEKTTLQNQITVSAEAVKRSVRQLSRRWPHHRRIFGTMRLHCKELPARGVRSLAQAVHQLLGEIRNLYIAVRMVTALLFHVLWNLLLPQRKPRTTNIQRLQHGRNVLHGSLQTATAVIQPQFRSAAQRPVAHPFV